MLRPAGQERLLGLDPDLGERLDDSDRAGADDLFVRIYELDVPEIHGKWGDAADDLAGYLIVDGAMLREIRTAQRTSAELVGPGDLVRPFEEDGEEDLPVRTGICWRSVQPVSLARIDGPLLQAASRWPALLASLIGRSGRRAQRLSVNLSITSMVRTTDRLLLMFWHMSEHWGRVSTDGVLIELPLTHFQLSKMVGAERPSVSTALGQLAQEGLVTRTAEGWRLRGPVPGDVGELLTRTDALGTRAR